MTLVSSVMQYSQTSMAARRRRIIVIYVYFRESTRSHKNHGRWRGTHYSSLNRMLEVGAMGDRDVWRHLARVRNSGLKRVPRDIFHELRVSSDNIFARSLNFNSTPLPDGYVLKVCGYPGYRSWQIMTWS